ncbi:AsmA family protein [Thiothrix subterranea]|uniref:AsmA family protein n=1 Tax=Thiothrix subterranea TaxID=2735563 RepID=A0AA51MTJ1_9GAMM|nr:AsmA family protein [Thiothrix subterranea]MDQ5767057.1 AsmA family protein [Thiothrix subterranea]WML88081.1 AsmA family protein [Thiothrix subterranea]
MPLLRLLAWLLALLLLIVAAIAVFALTFDANRYKPEITALLKEKTGRTLTIDGDISLSFYPDIALQLGQVAVGNAKGFNDEAFAEADNARVTVQFLPLLEQQLKINEVHLQGLKLNLHRNKSGKTNWQDLLPENSSKANASAGEAMTSLLGGMVITGVSVQDSQLHWQDDQQGKTVTLAPLNLQTGTFQPGKPVDLRLDAALTQNEPPLTMQLSLTTVAQLAENQEDFSLTDLRLQVKQPERLDTNLRGNLQGNLKKERASIPDLQADVILDGLGKVTLSSKLDVNLAKQQLNMTDLSMNADVKSTEIPGGQLQQQSSGKLSLNLESGKGLLDLPQTEIKAAEQQLTGSLQVRDPLLPSRVVDGKFSAAQLSYPPFTLQQATLGVQFTEGQVKLTPTGTLFKGAYQGEINLDTLQTPAIFSGEHTVKKLRTEELLFALTDDRLVTGALDMTAKFDSVVGDEQAFKQNLNGTIDLTLNEGTIRDANFAQKTREVIQLFEKERVNEVGETEVTFTQLKGQWQVKQGVFHTDENVMLAPHFQVKGNGDVNIVAESLDFKLRISEKPKPDNADGLFAPLHIHGAWDKPSYELELDVLLKERAEQKVQSEVDKLEQRLKDELKKKLNGLF